MTTLRIGVDIGGTFTDIVAARDDGALLTAKVPSTPLDYSLGIIAGLSHVLNEASASPAEVRELLHGTTVATNAILQRSGARTALVSTRGFRDVLELGRMRRPVLYDIHWTKPAPLIPRELRLEVRERIDANGKESVAVNEADVRRAAAAFRRADVESVAISLLNSYQNPRHERQVARLLAEGLPGIPLSLSSAVLREMDEYERTSTTVVNAYLRPVVESYVRTLLRRLRRMGLRAPVLLMQSSGALMPARAAAEHTVRIVESGPAAGVVGALHLSRTHGIGDLIAFDMGGTTAKASLIEAGQVQLAHEYEVGAGLSIGRRLHGGGGHVLRVPAIDLAEVGAGGGSIVSLDASRSLSVGPHSAGALPGPVCYGLGGTAATITDASVVLGYINAGQLAGGSVRLDAGAAAGALRNQVAEPLGLSLHEAAYGVHRVANATMIRALRAVTVERGRDPRGFTLAAFGGSGPIHAAEMARALSISRVLIPPRPGLFSAFGLLAAPIERHVSATNRIRLAAGQVPRLEAAFKEQEKKAAHLLQRDGYRLGGLLRAAHIRYVGQIDYLRIPIPANLGPAEVDEVIRQFEDEHQRTYGHRGASAELEVLNVLVTAGADVPVSSIRDAPLQSAGHDRSSRRVYFGEHGFHQTPVLKSRWQINDTAAGPMIIDEYDSTIVIPPSCAARVDKFGNIHISVS